MLFWGLLTVPNWCYDWVYTCAQIELMVSDVPVISYKSGGAKKHTKGEMDDLKRKWLEKKEKSKEKHLDLNKFLGGALERPFA